MNILRAMFLTGIVFGASWIANPAWAEPPALQLIIEQMGPDAPGCGIEQSSIEPIASLTLRNNGIRVSEAPGPYLHISGVAIRGQAMNGRLLGCSVSLQISATLHATNWDTGMFRPRNHVATIHLCDSGAVLTSGASEMGAYFLRELEAKIKLCLGQLEY